ncbi:hypothetical protein BGX28_006252 [Mortierella sp. GBA30]|nr:hypothetical protein BGX28_006252 [Mortierella sp. GBA30]
MATRFFRSIPHAVTVKDPYEEVFSLFTTETTDAPWAHNRSVSQQSTRLELELDFTPAPSPTPTPTQSQPGSRPDSRAGSYFTGATTIPTTTTTDAGSTESLNEGAPAGLTDSQSLSFSSLSSSEGRPDTSSKPKSPATRALLGSRKSSRSGSGGPARASTPLQKKPVVIHQSLSTLSQPGQTGTVVWDSSILMSKFLLSIKGLSMTCYKDHAHLKRNQQTLQFSTNNNVLLAQQEHIRRLEEQAECLTVSDDGALRSRVDFDSSLGQMPTYSMLPSKENLSNNGDNVISGPDVTDDDEDDDNDGDIDDKDEEEGLDGMLVFDPAETTILELGSGCGLLGIVMAELCQDLLLTDQKPVLPLLVKNLRKNLDKKYFDQNSGSTGPISGLGAGTSAMTKKTKTSHTDDQKNLNATKPCHIQVQELVWGQDLDQDLRRGFGLDFVVATDVVYNESVVPKLVQTLKQLCLIREQARQQIRAGYGEHFDQLEELLSVESSAGGSEHNGHPTKGLSVKKRRMDRTVVLLAQELRTDYVHLAFLERLEQEGFRMVRMPKQMMDADYQSGYVIYAFFLRDLKE